MRIKTLLLKAPVEEKRETSLRTYQVIATMPQVAYANMGRSIRDTRGRVKPKNGCKGWVWIKERRVTTQLPVSGSLVEDFSPRVFWVDGSDKTDCPACAPRRNDDRRNFCVRTEPVRSPQAPTLSLRDAVWYSFPLARAVPILWSGDTNFLTTF